MLAVLGLGSLGECLGAVGWVMRHVNPVVSGCDRLTADRVADEVTLVLGSGEHLCVVN